MAVIAPCVDVVREGVSTGLIEFRGLRWVIVQFFFLVPPPRLSGADGRAADGRPYWGGSCGLWGGAFSTGRLGSGAPDLSSALHAQFRACV